MRRVALSLAGLALALSACSSPAAPTAEPSATAPPPSPATTAPALAAPPAADPASPDATAVVSGDAEVVFDWTTDRCEDLNIPDLPARAWRDSDGTTHLTIAHLVNYAMTGQSLDDLTPNCEPIMGSDADAAPSHFNDFEWIASPYTDDGQTVYALIHNEYHGWEHGTCGQPDVQSCLDTSVTLGVSTDGGYHFADVAPAPGHLVASLPVRYEAGIGPYGIRTPSNIVKGADGYYYAYGNVALANTQQQYACAMRTDDLSDPTSWRYWDHAEYAGTFIDPYVVTGDKPGDHTCSQFQTKTLGAGVNDSVTYNEFLGQYVAMGLSADSIGGREVWGVYYSFSGDLTHWTKRKLLMEVPLPWTVGNSGTDLSYLYPSLLDPSSTSLNYDTTGEHAYLYITRHNHGQGSLDRDLMRYPITFSNGA